MVGGALIGGATGLATAGLSAAVGSIPIPTGSKMVYFNGTSIATKTTTYTSLGDIISKSTSSLFNGTSNAGLSSAMAGNVASSFFTGGTLSKGAIAGGGAGGFVGGFTTGFANGLANSHGDFGKALSEGWNQGKSSALYGAVFGGAIGLAAGTYSGIKYCNDNNINYWSGKQQGGLNLYKMGSDQIQRSTNWKEGDYTLNLPDQGNPDLN